MKKMLLNVKFFFIWVANFLYELDLNKPIVNPLTMAITVFVWIIFLSYFFNVL
jgi:hypothetical protein